MQPTALFDPAFAALRAVQAAASIVLFGELLFARVILDRGSAKHDGGHRAALTIASILAVVDWAAWLVLEAMAMGGVEWRDAIPLVPRVLAQTTFGHVWVVRAALLVTLCLWLLRTRPSRNAATLPTLLAGLALAALAWAGHANVQSGVDGVVHHLADALHVLAAGAWIGSLRPLAASLESGTESGRDVARTVGRYGQLGFACVAVLVATGVVNAAYTLGAPANLVDSGYGRLLMAKLVLFAALLGVAALNRWWLTPIIVRPAPAKNARPAAHRRMHQLAWIEAALGLGIITLAGALGAATPPMSH